MLSTNPKSNKSPSNFCATKTAIPYLYGPDLLEGANPERVFTEVILQARLRAAIDRINPHIPAEAREDAFKKALRAPALTVIDNNETFHRLLIDGVDVKFSVGEGKSRTDKVWLVDFAHPENNEFLAVNQYTVVENNTNKRPDIVLFINGLPLVVIELKNAADENADVQAAFHQLQTYQQVIPSLFTTNAFLVISDGWFAKAGTISSDYSRFMEWKSVDGARAVDSRHEPELEPLIKGLLNKKTLLDVIRHFIVFEKTKEKTVKKVAAYHQYFAVNKAIVSTIRASANESGRFVAEHPSVYGLPSVEHQPKGDQRAGVVWHTQGSGKSLSMVFYAGKLVLQEEMANPTLVVLTDRNDLDQQLFETFTNCQQLLRQTPAQAANRDDLKKLLSVASGGIVFTTIQKFLPEGNGAKYPTLTERRNVVVIADEAHRSQYDFIDGFAKHMRDALPNASFIGFTGTPIEKEDKNTQAVFGDYIDVYDIQQAVDDGATVRIYYESRLAKIELSAADQKLLDERVEEVTEDDELTDRQRRFAKWASKEAVVGSASRLKQVAADIVRHFEQRLSAADGKGMIVCMSRRICVALHREIIQLRPDWYNCRRRQGCHQNRHDRLRQRPARLAGAHPQQRAPQSDRQPPERSQRSPAAAHRARHVPDRLRCALPAHHVCGQADERAYPDAGHRPRQPRLWRQGRRAGGGLHRHRPGFEERHADLCRQPGQRPDHLRPGRKPSPKCRNCTKWWWICSRASITAATLRSNPKPNSTSSSMRQTTSPNSREVKEGNTVRNGKERFKENVIRLQKAFGLAVPHPEALKIRDDLAFFQAIKARFAKFDDQTKTRTNEEIETAIRQIVNDAIISSEVIDVFDAAGIKKPDISILSDEFLADIQGMGRKNLALELLKRLLNDEIKTRSKMNLVQGRKFSEMLAEAVKRYQNGLIDSARLIAELIQLAKDLRAADQRGEKMNMRPDELAFFDALADNPTAEAVLGDQTLKQIAYELVEKVRQNTSIDWQHKASVQAQLRVLVKRILRKYKYPPDDPATGEYTVSVTKVLDQAELLADYWTKSK